MEIVVCDDEKFFRKNIVKVVDSLFMNNDEDYKIIEFDTYDKNFEKLIKTSNPKIFILDIEMKNSISGIDIARKIRKVDWDSIIIIVTSHNELGYQAIKAQIMLLDFISKYDNYEESLKKAIIKATELVNKKKIIKVNYNGVSYVIYVKDISYIERDTVDRKCIIHFGNTTIPINKNLNELLKELGVDFYQTHRSCIVNLTNISYIKWNDNMIYFKDGNKIDLLSRSKKKGLRKNVRD